MDVYNILSLSVGKLIAAHCICVSIVPTCRKHISLRQVLNLILLHVWNVCVFIFSFLYRNMPLTRHLLCIPPTVALLLIILSLLPWLITNQVFQMCSIRMKYTFVFSLQYSLLHLFGLTPDIINYYGWAITYSTGLLVTYKSICQMTNYLQTTYLSGGASVAAQRRQI